MKTKQTIREITADDIPGETTGERQLMNEQKESTTFTINPACKLELTVSKDETRKNLQHVEVCYSEKLKRNVAVSTNGRSMAIVPIESVNEKVETCAISTQALIESRKVEPRGHFAITDQIEIGDTSTFPIPNQKLPEWEKAIVHTDEQIKFSIALNPGLLLDLAEAIGSNQGVVLEFYGQTEPIKVTPAEWPRAERDAIGLLMPMRIS